MSRKLSPTSMTLHGPQDAYWWMGMYRNEYLMAAGAGSLVRIAFDNAFTVGTVISVDTGAVGYSSALRIYGVIVTRADPYCFAKILGPATVRFTTPPTQGQGAVINADGTCTGADLSGLPNGNNVLGIVLKTDSGTTATVAVGFSKQKAITPSTMSLMRSSFAMENMAGCVLDLSSGEPNPAYPIFNIASTEIVDERAVVVFTKNTFYSIPEISVSSMTAGVIVNKVYSEMRDNEVTAVIPLFDSHAGEISIMATGGR